MIMFYVGIFSPFYNFYKSTLNDNDEHDVLSFFYEVRTYTIKLIKGKSLESFTKSYFYL